MASRSIHLAVTNQIVEKIEVKDINRLRLGAILPDAYEANRTMYDSHLKMVFSDGEMITYDLSKYLGLFQDKLQSDDLYPFDIYHLMEELQADFAEEMTGDIFFFTEEIAYLFIRQATVLCLKEIESLYHGERYIDEFEWAWKH